MLWFILAICAAITGALSSLLLRKVMVYHDAFAFSLLVNGGSFLLYLPIGIIYWQWPSDHHAWLFAGIAGILWTIVGVVSMLSFKYTEVSLRATLTETRSFWILLFAAFIAVEVITLQKILGVALVFLGVFVLSYEAGKQVSWRDRGVRWTLLNAMLVALAATFDKLALRYVNVETYAVLSCIIPTIFLLPYVLMRKQYALNLLLKRKTLPWAILAVTVLAISYYFTIGAYALADISVAYPVMRIGTIFAVLLGIMVLKEREHMARKIIASIIVVAGVLIVSSYTLF